MPLILLRNSSRILRATQAFEEAEFSEGSLSRSTARDGVHFSEAAKQKENQGNKLSAAASQCQADET